MAQVIRYDPASYVIPNRVTQYLRSVQESDWAAVPNTIIYHSPTGDPPEVAVLIAAAVPMQNWKVVAGVVQQLSQADLDAISAQQAIDAAAATAANLVERKAYAKDQLVSRTEFREAFEALCEVLVPQLNTLRAFHSLGNLTAAQVKTALKNAYDGKIDTWT